MYPVKNLPDILKWISKINPLTFGIDALKHAILGNTMISDFPLYVDLSVLIILSLVFVVLAGLMFERKK